MIRSILVGLDGSAHAYAALEGALVLAKPDRAQVRAMLVDDTAIRQRTVWTAPGLVMDPGFRPDVSGSLVDLEKTTKQTIANVRRTLKARKGPKIDLQVVEGDPVPKILAEAMTVDMVAIGRSGFSPAAGPIGMGSVARQIVRKAPCPIVVMQEGERVRKPILCPYSGSVQANRALRTAARMARVLRSAVDVLVCKEDRARGRALISEAKKYLTAQKIRASYTLQPCPAADWIVKVAERRKTGLICMGAYGHGVLAELLLGCTAEKVLQRTSLPCIFRG